MRNIRRRGSRLIRGHFPPGTTMRSSEFLCTGGCMLFRVLAPNGFGGIGKEKMIQNTLSLWKRIIVRVSPMPILRRCSGLNFSTLICGRTCWLDLVPGLWDDFFMIFLKVAILLILSFIECFFIVRKLGISSFPKQLRQAELRKLCNICSYL